MPAGSKGVSPRPPVVSGAAANLAKPYPTPAGVGRAPMHTQQGMGSFGPPLPAPAPVGTPASPQAAIPAPTPEPAEKQDTANGDRHASDLPPWDDEGEATAVGAQAAIPVRAEERAPATPAAAPPAPAPTTSSTRETPRMTPAAAPAHVEPLSTAARDEIRAIVRSVVEDALAPLSAQQRALLSRLEITESAVERLASTPVAAQVQARQPEAPPAPRAAPPAANPFLAAAPAEPISLVPAASIPVSTPPETHNTVPVHVPQARVPVIEAPATPRILTAPQRLPGGSLPPTGFGVVVAAPGRQDAHLPTATGSTVDFDMPDFGKKRKVMGRLLVGVLLLAVIAAVVATVMSHA